MAERYQTSELLEVFMVRALSEHMASSSHTKEPVTINCVNPGFCHSGLSRGAKGMAYIIFTVMKFFLARTTEVGSRTLVAAAATGEESNG